MFLNVNKGLLMWDLLPSVESRKFHIDFYDTGMSCDFASDLVTTDKETDKKTERTVHVNHPLILHGITIYQASSADGGSDLSLKTWNLSDMSRNLTTMEMTSMWMFPLDFDEK